VKIGLQLDYLFWSIQSVMDTDMLACYQGRHGYGGGLLGAQRVWWRANILKRHPPRGGWRLRMSPILMNQ